MKPINFSRTKTLLLLLVLLPFLGISQEKKEKETFGDKLAKAIRTANEDLSVDVNTFKDKECLNEFWTKEDIKKLNDVITMGYFEDGFFYARGVATIEEKLEGYGIDQGIFKTRVDRFLQLLYTHKNFIDFYKELTGNDVGDDTKGKVKYIRSIREGFKEFFEEGYFLNDFGDHKLGVCSWTAEVTLEFTKYNFPNATWNIIISYTKNCPCTNRAGKLKTGKGKITIPFTGIVTSTEAVINRTGKGEMVILELKCCPAEETSYLPEPYQDFTPADTYSSNTNFAQGTFATDTSGVVPNHLIGAAAGVGYFDQSEEFSACLGAQYLKPFKEGNKSYTSIGGSLNLETAFTGGDTDFSQTTINVGPAIEWGSKHKGKGSYGFTGGLAGNYVLGTRENSGFKDDISGYDIRAYGGLRADFDKGSINVQLDFLNYSNITFENEGGTEFESNSFNATIFKNPNVKVAYRWHK